MYDECILNANSINWIASFQIQIPHNVLLWVGFLLSSTSLSARNFLFCRLKNASYCTRQIHWIFSTSFSIRFSICCDFICSHFYSEIARKILKWKILLAAIWSQITWQCVCKRTPLKYIEWWIERNMIARTQTQSQTREKSKNSFWSRGPWTSLLFIFINLLMTIDVIARSFSFVQRQMWFFIFRENHLFRKFCRFILTVCETFCRT